MPWLASGRQEERGTHALYLHFYRCHVCVGWDDFGRHHQCARGLPTIQGAVDAAVDGDEVVVGPGTYTSSNTDPDNEYIVVLGTKHLVIRSSHGALQTILDGEDERGSFYCGSGGPGLTVIDGFTMQNGRTHYGAGLSTGMSEPTIQNCVIRWNNAIWWGGGIVCHGEDDAYARVTIINCDIYGNSAGYGGGGIYLYRAEATIDNLCDQRKFQQGI